MGPFERFDHDLRISNIRTALSSETKPAERARLIAALDHELAQCERLGCATLPTAEVGKR